MEVMRIFSSSHNRRSSSSFARSNAISRIAASFSLSSSIIIDSTYSTTRAYPSLRYLASSARRSAIRCAHSGAANITLPARLWAGADTNAVDEESTLEIEVASAVDDNDDEENDDAEVDAVGDGARLMLAVAVVVVLVEELMRLAMLVM